MPFFSVIIPLYNKEAYIKKSVESVLSQTFGNFELVVVDDGSTDASVAKLNSIKDKRIKLYSQKNSGASTARNFGIEKANCKHIALLDADDVWEKNHLEELHDSIQKFPEAALYCNAYKIKLSDSFSHDATYKLPKTDDVIVVSDYFEASTIHPLANSSTVAFKKKDFIDVGGFNPKISRSEDLDLWIRFGLHKKVVFNPTVTSFYDKTVEKSASKETHHKAEHQLFNSFKTEEKNNPSLKKYLDLNRYSLAIRCKCSYDYGLVKQLKKEISKTSLNTKQKFLLKTPSFVVRVFKKLHVFLVKNKIYISAYR